MLGRDMRIGFAIAQVACVGLASCAPSHQPIAHDSDTTPLQVQNTELSSAVSSTSDRGSERVEIDLAQVKAGRQIAVRDCSGCHALDSGSTSPNPEAPPLKTVLSFYDESALTSHLIEAIRIGHGEMPLFDLSVVGADTLIAYLRSIRSPADKQSK